MRMLAGWLARNASGEGWGEQGEELEQRCPRGEPHLGEVCLVKLSE